jgi:hypothetical protein
LQFRESLQFDSEGNRMAHMSADKFLGLMLGCMFVTAMRFMMLAALGGMFSPEQ